MVDLIANLLSSQAVAIAGILIAWFFRSPIDSKIIKAILKVINEIIGKILNKK